MSKLLFAALSISLLCGTRAPAQFTDSVVARVQEEIITAFRIYEESLRQEQIMRREMSGPELDKALATLRRHTGVRLIEQELIYAEFKSLGVEVPGSLVQQRLDLFVKEQAGGNRAAFETMLEGQGLTLRQFTDKLSRALAVELLVRERVSRNIEITPAEVQAYYAANQAEFAQPEQVRLETIVIRGGDKEPAKLDETVAKVQAELAAGKPFADVARAHSEDSFAEQGGDRGWQDTTKYGEALRGILTTLAPGTIRQEPLKLGSDVYILRLAGRRGGGIPALDGELQEKIQDFLARREETTRYRDFVATLRRKYHVKIFDRDLAEFWESR